MKDAKSKSCDPRIQKALRISVFEGGAYGVFDGFGLRYITPYALFLGVSNAAIGPLITLPQMLGNLAQLFVLKPLTNGRQRKNITVTGVSTQAALVLFLVLVGIATHWGFLSPQEVTAALLLGYTLMIISGTAAGPAWSSWMGDLVPPQIGTYFGKRNQIIGFVTIISLISAGLILQVAKQGGWLFGGFVLVLTLGFLGRATSAALLKIQYEPPVRLHREYYFTLRQFIQKIPHSNFGKFVVYVALIQFAVGISAPFFPVFMLKELHFNYLQFTIITTVMPFFNMLFMPLWGRFADRYGNWKVIQITSWFLPFIPWFWALTAFYTTQRLWVLLTLFAIEVVSGFAWAGFNLATTNFIYDAVTKPRIAICVTYYNIFIGTGLFIGGLVGSRLAALTTLTKPFSALVLTLLVSGFLRLVNILLFLPQFKEVRTVPAFDRAELQKRLTALSPLGIFQGLSQKFGNPRL